ncbi:hypothetical protein I4F81_010993 [Pyropia yezoensis]|uniref:Uncharacterized protein n=1 Tax=Pyropia yezoensis TaxID=2788 RepID=A0ACC3CE96_PYRYE|nr:hypothetical protein I4F81_010993 [Neopyropia yezoensis]
MCTSPWLERLKNKRERIKTWHPLSRPHPTVTCPSWLVNKNVPLTTTTTPPPLPPDSRASTTVNPLRWPLSTASEAVEHAATQRAPRRCFIDGARGGGAQRQPRRRRRQWRRRRQPRRGGPGERRRGACITDGSVRGGGGLGDREGGRELRHLRAQRGRLGVLVQRHRRRDRCSRGGGDGHRRHFREGRHAGREEGGGGTVGGGGGGKGRWWGWGG